MHVIVIGAGIAGLGTSLLLARAGHEITLFERDRLADAADADAAFALERRGVPQVRHSHAYLARSRNLLRDELPDVLAALLEAGVQELAFTQNMPATIDDPSARAGDSDLVALGCRRTTFEWVLRRAAIRADGVALRSGEAVSGVCIDRDSRGARGVRTGVGEVRGDAVVDAGGRRSPLGRWLADEGYAVAEESSPTGIVYLSRFYKLLPGSAEPVMDGPWGGDLGYLKYAIFPGDNRAYSVTLALPAGDAELRSALKSPTSFQRAAAILPGTRAWVEADRADPLTDVHVMARLDNTRRTLSSDGAALVRNLYAVGDAAVHTNPLYGRGCSLALVHAKILANGLAAHPADPDAAAAQIEAETVEQVLPWYHAAVAQDRQNIAAETSSADATASPLAEVLRHGLLPAMRKRAEVFRGFWRAFNLLEDPNWFLGQPDLLAQIWEFYESRATRTPEYLGPVERADMLDRIRGAGAAV